MTDPSIYVVDDDGEMRAAVSEALTRTGFRVCTFQGGAEVLATFQPGKCAAVVTDVRMPGMSGIELLKRLQAVSPEVPVVVMTAYGTVQDAVDAMKEGAFDYLLKPFSLDDLEAVVRRAAGLYPGHPERTGRRGVTAGSGERAFVTRDRAMLKTLSYLREIAPSPSTVLVQGESGTGKELIARFIHRHSPGVAGPFLAVNCAAIPEGLLESELFGHEKGAFSGAVSRKIGKFERAGQGTLLLDEVGEMPLSLQVKLLRVLQEKEIERVGGSGPIPVSARIVATTNRDLAQAVAKGRFRQDLFFRLNVIPVSIPPLRERLADIQPLSEYFLRGFSRRERKRIEGVTDEGLAFLASRTYPGNVRELQNLMERAVLLCRGDRLALEHFTALDAAPAAAAGVEPCLAEGGSMRDMEQTLILQTLQSVHGNRTRASALLGISLRTLRNKLAEYRKQGIPVPPYDPVASSRARGASLGCSGG